MTTVELKNAPEIKDILKSIGYRKHQCFLSVFPERGVNVNSYWNGGSKSEYVLFDLVSRKIAYLPTRTHPYFEVSRYSGAGETEAISVDHVGNLTLKFIPENVCLIKYGFFCGKPATAHIYLHPNNMTKMLR